MTRLPNGCESVGPLAFPEDLFTGEPKVLCGCAVRATGIYAFIKNGRLWIRVRHGGGAGFCEFEAVSDDMREQRARRVLHPALKSRG